MATKQKKTKKVIEQERAQIDNYARVLQIVAIVSVVAIFIINGSLENADVPIWVPAGLLGVAVGLSPQQIAEIVKNIFTAGSKK